MEIPSWAWHIKLNPFNQRSFRRELPWTAVQGRRSPRRIEFKEPYRAFGVWALRVGTATNTFSPEKKEHLTLVL